MIGRSFFGLIRPKLRVPPTPIRADVEEIPLPQEAHFLLKHSNIGFRDLLIKAGDRLRTGQRLLLSEQSGEYLVSPVTGRVSVISEYKGYLGRVYPRISVQVEAKDEWDDAFAMGGKRPGVARALTFLAGLPGAGHLRSLFQGQTRIDTLIVNGLDRDLLVSANLWVAGTEAEALTEGIGFLREGIGAERVLVVLPPEVGARVPVSGAEVRVLSPRYPESFPPLLTRKLLGRIVPPGRTCRDVGVGFVSAEEVVALAKALETGSVPVEKVLTVIRKDHTTVNVRARVGTPVGDVLEHLKIELRQGDRLVLGGPMTGEAIYSGDMPVLADTDALMVQDREGIAYASDNQCINCGECVRACPARVPVNMLVRLLANGLYEEAAERYDLLSCVECGLCSYVCIARIPVFQYIMLGKHEFSRIESAEESNG
ncbi:MAG: 4Fe-4S dicluster domain-containing protein [Deltaproteobacteria bacterium]|nr:4Fe-4S dicluster domain-containing protein [Deltaproteobacteria bacterium]